MRDQIGLMGANLMALATAEERALALRRSLGYAILVFGVSWLVTTTDGIISAWLR